MNSIVKTVEAIELSAKRPTAPFAETSKYVANQIVHSVHPPSSSLNIPFAEMAQAAYNPKDDFEGYTLHKGYSSPDRAVYVKNDNSHVVISFRGTNPKNPRDIGTDALLGIEATEFSTRFWHAEQITKHLIQKYGRQNVYSTGHSLGGSQALHVSQKFGIHAEVYNPFISISEATTHEEFPDSVIHYNITDPVSTGVPFVKTKKTYYHYNTKKWPGLPQHSIENMVHPHEKKKASINTPATSAPIINIKIKPKHILKHVTQAERVDAIRNVPQNERSVQVVPLTHIKQHKSDVIATSSKQQTKPQVTTYRRRSHKPRKLYFGLNELIYT